MPGRKGKSAWMKVAFGDVARLCRERSADPVEDGFVRYVGLEHLEPGDLKLRRWGNTEDGTTFTSVFRAGQVLFGKRRAYQRKVALADFEGVCSGDIYVLETNDPKTLLPELLPFICQTDRFFEHAVGTSAGSLSPRTNWESLAAYEFALPPLDEQRRIAEVLGAVTACNEALVTAVQTAETLRKAAVRDMFARAMRKWPVRPIGDVLKVTTGGTPDRGNASYWRGDVSWVKTGEVNYGTITSTEEFITKDGLNSSAAKVCPPDTVLVALYGQGPTRGRVALLGISAATNQACAAILPGTELDARFVYRYLESNYEGLRGLAQGAAQPNLNLAMIKGFPIPVPPIAEQRKQVSSMENIAGAKSTLMERYSSIATVKKALCDEVFA
jgi:type I restriction enzyme, S subunit